MRWVVLICALAALGLVALGWGRWRFAQVVQGIEGALNAAPVAAPRDDLPPEVAAYAAWAMNGQAPARLIRLEQRAKMEMRPGAGWKPLEAQQVIAASEAGFLWQAVQGPVAVIDSYAAGRGLLEVRALHSIRLARAAGPDIDRAEAMRYLAELPWCPDAIWLNHALRWQVLADGRWQVSLGDAEVTFTLEDGEIRRMEAKGRPALEGGETVLRDWLGIFDQYKVIGGRRIPGRGQVGYGAGGDFAPYFIGWIEGLTPAD